ncbi:hypothetical protein Acsp01_01060 [Actinoplanes sp. NBRC 101535]|nr:hypothetical protein Acsp01_01060 [Actinoplanes sp. NBRC 101535]
MNADALDHRTRTHTECIPPALVTRLLELGHAEEVAAQAGRGEWFCAREWSRDLARRVRRAEALEVLAHYRRSSTCRAGLDQPSRARTSGRITPTGLKSLTRSAGLESEKEFIRAEEAS